MDHVYNSDFYDYIEEGSRASARALIPVVSDEIEMDSLLDVGCGRGAWLSEWKTFGFNDIIGIDGDYVVRADFHIDPMNHFRPHDITKPFDLTRKFDLAQCLEVAEHIPSQYAKVLVESVVRHSDIVIFSAAQRGQGGENHVNEQPIEFWRELFNQHGYSAYDYIRPLLKDNPEVMPWYKYNTLIYANERGKQRLSDKITSSALLETEKAPPGGDLKWRLRRFLVGLLPKSAVDIIAIANARRISNGLK